MRSQVLQRKYADEGMNMSERQAYHYMCRSKQICGRAKDSCPKSCHATFAEDFAQIFRNFSQIFGNFAQIFNK